jgi:formyltetrahydrofolate deformylase
MVILIQCKDSIGLVAAIAQVISESNSNIIAMREYVDIAASRFFARIEIQEATNTEALKARLKQVLPSDADILINPLPDKKIVVFVTKEYHCLSDILVRNYFKTLGASIECVVGNHAVLEDICKRFDVPFHFVSHEAKPKVDFENELHEIVNNYQPDYLVLAKFMRILSADFVEQYPYKIINIHHSFLPAFIGANPYKKAFDRGVKLIGATAHFVTNDLDEGPIITQQTIPVDHSFTASDMVRSGKEIEKAVLAKALQYVFEDRVFTYENKTVVFE